ncbi:LysE family translocator [Aliikangiella maris]|uniref:LysE family translocator n=2 Tax=Aliikangiella maris TaxID=3162458 RepID=A0ABV2BQA3_9GAMM
MTSLKITALNFSNAQLKKMLIDYTLLTLFIPTFALVSSTPGMCMTLALTLGMTIGIKRTFWMMWGELAGVALVSILSVIGVAGFMLKYPQLFEVVKYLGGAYLAYLGVQLWRSKGKMAINLDAKQPAAISNYQLMIQGFITAVANPKGWAFMLSLLPPFINPELPLRSQLIVLVIIILLTEFIFLTLYASGGRTLQLLLVNPNNVRLVNRLSGTLMIAVGIWLAIG